MMNGDKIYNMPQNILLQVCIFINNNNINLDFHTDGLHLNDFGTAILKMNILNAFTHLTHFQRLFNYL